MSTNISKDYLTFTKKNLTTYAKLILDKSYKKDIFIQLLDTYYDVRYYNYYDHLYKSYESNINNFLNELDKYTKNYYSQKLKFNH